MNNELIPVKQSLIGNIGISEEQAIKVYMDYKIELTLENQSHLTMFIFNPMETRWIFNYEYRVPVDEDDNLYINRVKLIVNYRHGVVESIEQTMEMIWTANLYKEYYLGIDVSPNSKLFLELKYEKKNGVFNLIEIIDGKGDILSIPKICEETAIARTTTLPFIINSIVWIGHKDIKVPFINNEGDKDFFIFPVSLIK